MAPILNEEARARFARQMDIEVTYAADTARYRVSVFRQQGRIGAVLRLIPLSIRSMDELMIPAIVRDLILRTHGLVLVTGPARSGKSTTLAALVDHINAHRRAHIVTIEDPIEYLHQDRLGSVDQREVGRDTHSYPAAMRSAMHQNPDVIVLSDPSDPETIRLAIDAAETGYLVISTMHANDAAHTIERIVDLYPAEEQRQVRTQLATNLLCIISQTLLPKMDVPGRAAAFEVMVAIPSIRSLIREGKTLQIMAEIQTGSQYGMEALDHSLAGLVRRKIVRYEDALAKSTNPRDFEQRAGVVSPVRR
jgi:twitching motility protein PilT